MDGRTDRLTDRQMQGEKQYVSRPLQGGDIIQTKKSFCSDTCLNGSVGMANRVDPD